MITCGKASKMGRRMPKKLGQEKIQVKEAVGEDVGPLEGTVVSPGTEPWVPREERGFLR